MIVDFGGGQFGRVILGQNHQVSKVANLHTHAKPGQNSCNWCGKHVLKRLGVLVDFGRGQFGHAYLVPKSPSEQNR